MPFGTKASRKIFARETRDKITAKHFVFFGARFAGGKVFVKSAAAALKNKIC
jgi:hypothetical protein